MKSQSIEGLPSREAPTAFEGLDLFIQEISLEILERLPASFVRTDRVVPVGLMGSILVVAVEDPDNFDLYEKARFVADRELQMTAASSAALDFAIDAYYPACDD